MALWSLKFFKNEERDIERNLARDPAVTAECKQGHNSEVVITTFIEDVFMSVVTKRSSCPVATLAITLLTANLPTQCEKLSTETR